MRGLNVSFFEGNWWQRIKESAGVLSLIVALFGIMGAVLAFVITIKSDIAVLKEASSGIVEKQKTIEGKVDDQGKSIDLLGRRFDRIEDHFGIPVAQPKNKPAWFPYTPETDIGAAPNIVPRHSLVEPFEGPLSAKNKPLQSVSNQSPFSPH